MAPQWGQKATTLAPEEGIMGPKGRYTGAKRKINGATMGPKDFIIGPKGHYIGTRRKNSGATMGP